MDHKLRLRPRILTRFIQCIISADQMVSGHERIYSNLDDISLDIPHAYTILPKIVQKSAQKKLITDRLKLQCPNKWVTETNSFMSHNLWLINYDMSHFCSPIISGAENGFRPRVTSLMRFMIISYLRHVTDYVRLGYVHLVLIHFQKLKIWKSKKKPKKHHKYLHNLSLFVIFRIHLLVRMLFWIW